jgi:hypothetical protein
MQCMATSGTAAGYPRKTRKMRILVEASSLAEAMYRRSWLSATIYCILRLESANVATEFEDVKASISIRCDANGRS